MSCLLCQEEFASPFWFSDLFLLKKEDPNACEMCQANFEPLTDKGCPSCCKPNQEGKCSDCSYWEQHGYTVNHTSLYRYNQAMKTYFQAYKFHGDYLLRMVFAKAIREGLTRFKGYCLVPVPVSEQTYQERGFNQVEGLLMAANCRYVAILEKDEKVKQSQLNRDERLQMKNHYRLKQGTVLPERVLLVDDIYTTGATLLSIKAFLLASGVKEVKTFSLCR